MSIVVIQLCVFVFSFKESEARTEVLRDRAKTRQRNEDVVRECTSTDESTARHINFFAEEEEGVKFSCVIYTVILGAA